MERIFGLVVCAIGYVVFLGAFLGTFMALVYAVRYAITSGEPEKKGLTTPIVISCLSLSLFLISIFVTGLAGMAGLIME